MNGMNDNVPYLIPGETSIIKNIIFREDFDSCTYTTRTTTINSCSDSIVNLTSLDADPNLQMYSIGSFDTTKYKYLNCRYRVVSGTAGNLDVFFLNSTYTTPNIACKVQGVLTSDGEWNIITLDMSGNANWTGSNCTGWRFDYTSASGVTIEYDYVELVGDDVANSVYPPAQSDTYVKATSQLNGSYNPFDATDPSGLVTGTWNYVSWIAEVGGATNQRFHIDLGYSKVINKIYYENQHNSGADTAIGVKNFTLWGSNDATAFATLTYGTDTNWTQITGLSQTYFDEHTSSNVADPKYITFANTETYRYYAFKFADNYGHPTRDYMSVRRIELQHYSQYTPAYTSAYTKATSNYTTGYAPYFTTDPTQPLTGSYGGNQWLSVALSETYQRFNIDLGVSQPINKIYYENSHHSGGATTTGAKNFTFWGSNDATDFNEASSYPPANSATYIKATSTYQSDHASYNVTDPTTSLVGNSAYNSWLASNGTVTNQRFHIDLGSAKTINKIYYENFHSYGIVTDRGVKNFTLWGSNEYSAFNETTYATDTNWTQITGVSQNTFDQHNSSNASDPKYITINGIGSAGTSLKPYRYYAFKFADNWGNATYLGVRRIELQGIQYQDYSPCYPPAYSDTYVKATSYFHALYSPWFATDYTTSLIGSQTSTTWLSDAATTNQRLHIDLGSAKTINRIYYENYHSSGVETDRGVNNFTLWGSNDSTAFGNLTYSVDTDWTQITCDETQFEEHIASNVEDPKYIEVTNSTAYRYYAFKFADNHGDATYMGLRCVELQEDVDDRTFTELTCDVNQFEEHTSVDESDPKFINVSNSTAYRYYSFKLPDTWGSNSLLGLRRIELQTVPVESDPKFLLLPPFYKCIPRIYYPPEQSFTYVMATTLLGLVDEPGYFEPYNVTNPETSLTGSSNDASWLSDFREDTDQRFHIDLGSAKLINKIYYENYHSYGDDTNWGVKNFTLWGSNESSAFGNLTYSVDTDWTEITGVSQNTFDQHTSSDVADPNYIDVSSSTSYRYYAFKFADNWGSLAYMGVRRITLMRTAYYP